MTSPRLFLYLSCSSLILWTPALKHSNAETVIHTDDTILVVRENKSGLEYSRLSDAQSEWNWLADPIPFKPSVQLIKGDDARRLDWKFQSIEQTQSESASITKAKYIAKNPALELEIRWTAHPGPGPIEQVIEVRNLSARPVMVGSTPLLSLQLTARKSDNLQHWWVEKGGGKPSSVGTHVSEIDQRFMHRGISSPHSDKRDSGEMIPWQCIVDEQNHLGIYTLIASSGHVAQETAAQNGDRQLNVVLELDEEVAAFRTKINPGATFAFPSVSVGCFRGGVDDGCNRLHRWAERWQLPPSRDDRLPLLINCSWGHRLDIDEEICQKMIDDSSQLGFEMFHIDAGWYRHVGWWQPDEQKFPHGMRSISQYAHAKGQKFGLWVAWVTGGDKSQGLESLSPLTPEMTSWFPTNSDHSWKQPENGWQGNACCLASAEARNWCLDELRRIIREYQLDMLEHDQTVIVPSCEQSTHDHTASSVDVGLRAANGYCEVYDTLRQEFPDLLFENCVNGGCTVDYGIMQRCHYVSATDTYNPISNRQAFYDASYPLPPRAIEAYLGEFPVPSIGNFKYMLRSGMMGLCNVMIDTNSWSLEEHKAAKDLIETYKTRIRPLIRTGNLYHISERPRFNGWDAIQYYDPESGQGVVFVFRAKSMQKQNFFSLQGLESSASYRVESQDGTLEPRTVTGKDLMNGLHIELPAQETSELVLLKKL